MCPPARVKTINSLSNIQQQRVGANKIRPERSEQETDSGVERFVSFVIERDRKNIYNDISPQRESLPESHK